MSANQLERIISCTDIDKPQLAEDGSIYFIKRSWKVHRPSEWSTQWQNVEGSTTTEHVTPEQCKFIKSVKIEIVVAKQIQSTESLEENEEVYFKMPITIAVPKEDRYRFYYLYQTKNDKIFLKNLDSGGCMEVSLNNTEFCTKGKSKKLADNTLLPKSTRIYTLAKNGELELRIRRQL